MLKASVARVEEEGVVRAIVFIEDITQQRLSNQSQNAFIAQATHELRTPLTTIRLYCEEAIEAEGADEQVREKALNVISSETRRLERIVGDMLCVSEIEAGSLNIRRESMRTEQLFTELEEDYQAQAKDKSITLDFDLPPKFPTIQADRDRLGQALHNLMGNAIKYTPSGGTVSVTASFDEHDAMSVSITRWLARSHACTVVTSRSNPRSIRAAPSRSSCPGRLSRSRRRKPGGGRCRLKPQDTARSRSCAQTGL